ncbi:hypothetical protein D3C71_1806180 [compost metagenome]
MLVRSASTPSTAAPRPPMPKAKPKNRPDTMPILPGINSCAYTRMAENADESTRPMMMVSITVQNRSACGRISAKGATPRIDAQITGLRPMRSPTGPPARVPTADANRNTNSSSCAFCTPTSKRCIR